MEKMLHMLGACVAVVCCVVVGAAYFFFAQRADYAWNPQDLTPAFAAEHPRVLFDDGHDNASTISLAGRYWPFGRLPRADDALVGRGRMPFTAGSLAGVPVLVVASATGAPSGPQRLQPQPRSLHGDRSPTSSHPPARRARL